MVGHGFEQLMEGGGADDLFSRLPKLSMKEGGVDDLSLLQSFRMGGALIVSVGRRRRRSVFVALYSRRRKEASTISFRFRWL